ncbi:uncharacterized protein LOC107637249 [Arachis ipaensis]|uniref:uncharacterized protein LOC107637249 n=1 Tax=Arachis ipaensis TaxID=130454 RepID=UPI0007AFC6F2|nr:uncharacterized protein LOC107637249 [Arachis ipaensis]XP_029148372.1 uncharacterized protein LOC114925240 [Arachis hypogaea]
MLTVKDYSIRRGVEYRVMESNHLKYHERCKEFEKGCTWMTRVSLRARKGTWEVRRIDKGVARSYRRNVRVQANLQEDVIGETEGGSTDIRGLGRVLRQATSLDPWCAVYHGGDGFLVEDVSGSSRIDDTHLYGKYRGTLLLAIAQDENSNILPIAFSLVEGENAESWSFFLTNLRQHVTPQQGILVISDRYNGIKAALENPNSGWLPPHTYRAFCIRHVAANFALSFKGTDAKSLLVNAAYVKTEVEFHYWFDIMRTENPAMCDWTNKIEYDKWTQHQDGGRRFGHMTTNISECVNFVLKGTWNLPVTALVKSTYGRLAELFVIRGQTAEAQLARVPSSASLL